MAISIRMQKRQAKKNPPAPEAPTGFSLLITSKQQVPKQLEQQRQQLEQRLEQQRQRLERLEQQRQRQERLEQQLERLLEQLLVLG